MMSTGDPEIDAMQTLVAYLRDLPDDESRRRVIAYAQAGPQRSITNCFFQSAPKTASFVWA